MKGVIVSCILGFVFACIGAPVLRHGVSQYRSGQASEAWPTVAGTVMDSRLVALGEKNRSVGVEVSYRYAVDGRDFDGTRIRFADITTGGRSDPATVQKRYPAGAEIRVHVDPQDATNAVLEPGVFGQVYGVLAAGAAFLGAGLILGLFVAGRVWRKPA